MKNFLTLIDSIKGLELVLFSFLLLGFQYLIVSLAFTAEPDFSLYASSWAMAVLASLTTIKALRFLRMFNERGL